MGSSEAPTDQPGWEEDVNSSSRGGDGAEQQSNSEQSLSQIGSLVSYSINYMDKRWSKFGAEPAAQELGVLREVENASDSEDASVLAEKEESQPSDEDSIDTIEEEVDLSASEGSDTTPLGVQASPQVQTEE